MLKTLVILPDGTQLDSGVGKANAIQSCTITECVNSGQDLVLGSCCASMAELCMYAPDGAVRICAGEELQIYRQTEDGVRHKVGVFTAEKPTRQTANTLKITAYDAVTKLDRDLSRWLASLEGWPYTLFELAVMICDACDLKLKNTEIPNGGYPVRRFSGEGITGRRLMQWIAQAAGRFCRATTEGEIEFAWYTPVQDLVIAASKNGAEFLFVDGELQILAEDITAQQEDANVILSSDRLAASCDGEGNVSLLLQQMKEAMPFFQNGLSFEEYEIAPIEKVQIRQDEEDVGTVYPDGIPDSVNTYIIQANPLLSAVTGQELTAVAEVLYEILREVRYTPCKVVLPADMRIRAGNTVQITDRKGRRITAYVMTKTQKGQRDTLECTGNATLESTTALNNRQVSSVQGKLLKLRMDVEGLRVENTDQAGTITRIEADLQGIRGQVSSQSAQMENMQTQMTQVDQTAQNLQITVEKIQSDGVDKIRTSMGYTFDDEGLQISREGQPMKNLLDNTGMYVTRNGQTLLQANDEGVVAVDVRVENYLVVGEHARFEDYSDGADHRRTACFWLGG